ncbi:MAG TPA: ribonuclease Z [Acidobacteriota bacterium]|nr:ribonuclease Z [Acidobacteriota bacterium]
MVQITLLGTSCMVPTKERNVSGLYVDYQGQGILMDCGEGTQRQMNIAGINRHDVKVICLSHWHADHVAGVLGLIQTLSGRDSPSKLIVIGPVETKKRLDLLLSATYFDQRIAIDVIELEHSDVPKKAHETSQYYIEYISLDHGIPCVAFSFIEKDRRRIKTQLLPKYGLTDGPILARFQKGEDVEVNGKLIKADEITTIVTGKKITYVPDTGMCKQAVDISTNADLLIAESTYAADEEDKAEKYNHLTSAQAAQIATMSNSKRLVLTHVSQRYKSPADLIDDAKAIFAQTELGFDFMQIKL